MTQFKIGDRVRLKEGFGSGCGVGFISSVAIGTTGVVCTIETWGEIGVNFGKDVAGHACGGACPGLFGQDIHPEYLELVEENKSTLAYYEELLKSPSTFAYYGDLNNSHNSLAKKTMS